MTPREDRAGYLRQASTYRRMARTSPSLRPVVRAYLDAAASARRRERESFTLEAAE